MLNGCIRPVKELFYAHSYSQIQAQGGCMRDKKSTMWKTPAIQATTSRSLLAIYCGSHTLVHFTFHGTGEIFPQCRALSQV